MEIFILLTVLILQDPELQQPATPDITWDIEVAPTIQHAITPMVNYCAVYS